MNGLSSEAGTTHEDSISPAVAHCGVATAGDGETLRPAAGTLRRRRPDNTALDLATNEYPVSFMSPGAAAAVGVAIEMGGAVLLALGFMTRYAAVPMLMLSMARRTAAHCLHHVRSR